MITFYWIDQSMMEIWSGISLKPKGKLVIRVHKGRITLQGMKIYLQDPLNAILLEKTIPEVIEGEYWQIAFALTNYLMKGNYHIHIRNENQEYLHFQFNLNTRKQENQVFLLETKLVVRNLQKSVKSFNFRIQPIPNNLLLQNTGEAGIRGAILAEDEVKVEDIWGSSQKTVSWWSTIQPSFLPLDTHLLIDQPDEFYIFNDVHYTEEPGLEIHHPKLDAYNGSEDYHYPIQVIYDVLQHVHRNMRYVRQTQERGLEYALKYGRGDCTEYSAFFVSLLRRLGIKARLVSGMGRSNYNNWISHAFAEVYLYHTWVPIDVVKPPKPYLQLGNRGDLIGIHRSNWLDPDHKQLQISFMAAKNTRPRIEMQQKVTEAGMKSIPREIRNLKPKKHLSNLLRTKHEMELKIVNDSLHQQQIKLFNVSDDLETAILVAGSIDFGRVVAIQAVNLPDLTLILPKLPGKEPIFLLLLDERGKSRVVNQII